MGIFNINSGFSKFMDRAIDVLIINFLWILCSLPVVTIGASTSAAFYVMLKMVDDEEGYVGKMFFKAFKDNFKQGTIMWCITAPCIYFSYLIWQAIIKGDPHFLIIIGAIVFTAIVICVNIYTYPLIARYENTLKHIIQNSAVLSMLYFGRTVMLVGILALEFILISWNKWTLFAGILIGPGCIVFTIAGISKRIFQNIEKNGGVIVPPVQDSTESEVDEEGEIQEESEADEDDDESTETEIQSEAEDEEDEMESDDEAGEETESEADKEILE